MRRARWLILLVIAILVSAVGGLYYSQRKLQRRNAIAPPAPLSSSLSAAAENWSYTQMDGDRPVVAISARNFRQSKEQGAGELEGVELKIFKKDASEYDRVQSAKVLFDRSAGTLFSEGAVEITMGIPADAKPQGRLLNIKSSGVRFDIKTGKAETDKPASFSLDLGEGRAVGVVYDPATRELKLSSHVRLTMRAKSPKGKAMLLETGALVYKERESVIYLSPWAKLTRGTLTLEAGNSIVHLNEGYIKDVEALGAHGRDSYPNREIEYSAAELRMQFDEEGVARQIAGTRGARLVSTTQAARTTITADLINLDFLTDSGESVLKEALAMGHSVAESKPVPRPKTVTPETRVLRSEVIHTLMRPGGREIEKVSTDSPGRLEFLPNSAGQRRREMDAERMTIEYGEQNRIRSYSATTVATKTFREARKKGDPEAAFTWSKELAAAFDPQTGQMTRLEQWQDFRYEEGARKARADRAVLEPQKDRITLAGRARVWDPSGAASGDRIDLDQKSSDFTAEGNVTSTRLPDRKAKSASMLSRDEALQAKARKMYSQGEQSVIFYEGNAVLWQGGNRLHADFVTIDRENQTLAARGSVFSQFVDQPKQEKGKPAPKQKPAAVYTTVRAPELLYTDEQKLAHYKGGVVLNRPNMDVKAQDIKAWLKEEEGGGSSLDRAFATGKVDILQRSPNRTRHGTGEQAEYYAGEEKVTLEGGQPQLVDSLKGFTKGRKLTWYSNDDRLIVDGAERQPGTSIIRRKK